MIAGVCRICGCTQDVACAVVEGKRVNDEDLAELHERGVQAIVIPCTWVEADLCSACVDAPPPPLLFDAFGHPLRGAP